MKNKGFSLGIGAAITVISIVYFWLNTPNLLMAPDISLNLIDGRTIEVKSLQGKPLLNTFWATTCSSCMKEMPHLVALYEDLHQEGLEIIGIAMSYDPPNLVVALSEKKQIPYPIALDIDGSAARAFGDVDLTPTSFLISAEGKIIQKNIGELDIKQLRIKINSLLNQTDTTLS